MTDWVDPGYRFPHVYEDQTLFLDISDDDIEPMTQAGQEIWRDYVNDLGPADESVLQLPFLDMELSDHQAIILHQDEEDVHLDDLINREFAELEEEVPFEWQYWLHDENTLPPVDESNAPPLESGWADPDTEEIIP